MAGIMTLSTVDCIIFAAISGHCGGRNSRLNGCVPGIDGGIIQGLLYNEALEPGQ